MDLVYPSSPLVILALPPSRLVGKPGPRGGGRGEEGGELRGLDGLLLALSSHWLTKPRTFSPLGLLGEPGGVSWGEPLLGLLGDPGGVSWGEPVAC